MKRATLYKRVADLRRRHNLQAYSRKQLNAMPQTQLMRELSTLAKAKGQASSLFRDA